MTITAGCLVDGCERQGRLVRGMCSAHYQKWRKHGDPMHEASQREFSAETKAKISASLTGNQNAKGHQNALGKTWTLTEEQRVARRGPRPAMYTDEPGYTAVHNWMRRHYRRCGTCEACGVERVTYWANISGKNRRDRDDFWELCVPCHKLFDYLLRIEQADPAIVAVLRARRA